MFVRWMSIETSQKGGRLNQNNPNQFVNSTVCESKFLCRLLGTTWQGDKKGHRASQPLSLAPLHTASHRNSKNFFSGLSTLCILACLSYSKGAHCSSSLWLCMCCRFYLECFPHLPGSLSPEQTCLDFCAGVTCDLGNVSKSSNNFHLENRNDNNSTQIRGLL